MKTLATTPARAVPPRTTAGRETEHDAEGASSTRGPAAAWRPKTAARYLTAAVAAFVGACTVLRPGILAGNSSLSIGEWTGTTSQGMPIAFSVSSNDTVTNISLGYRFNDCSGTLTFSDLLVPTNPNVVCIPGPCSGVIESYRAFAHADGALPGGARTTVNGLFLPGNHAQGQAGFFDFPDCGTAAPVEWTATRQ